MQDQRLRPVPTATMLLAVALTMSGALIYLLQAVGVHFRQDRYLFVGSLILAILLGLSLAEPVSRSSAWRWIILMLFAGWTAITVAMLVTFQGMDFPHPLIVLFWTVGVGLVIVLVCVVTVARLGRLHRGQGPFFLFAFFFLGCTAGIWIELLLQLAGRMYWTRSLYVGAPLVFLCAYAALELTDVIELPLRSPSPTWPRRLRWTLLGGLPPCVAFGMTTYITTEIAPFPLIWLLPLVCYQVSWVVAFARMTPWQSQRAARLVQALALLAILSLLVPLAMIERQAPFLLLALAAMTLPFLVPHRLTLPAQSSLLAVAFLQMFSKFEFPMTTALLIHLCSCVLVCWGCHGEAVKDAPEADRVPEFMLFTQGGAIVFAIAFSVLPPILMPKWPLEYPVALGTCLVLRALPWTVGQAFQPDVPR